MTAPMEIRNHLYPTAHQTIPVGADKLTNITLGDLAVGTTYRVSIYVNVDNPTTGASCTLRTGNGYIQPISASSRVVYDFTATATSHGISITSSGCDQIRILNGICVDTKDWNTLTGLNLPGNFFNYATLPE